MAGWCRCWHGQAGPGVDLGNVTATDFIAARGENRATTPQEQETQIATLANEMAVIRADYWRQTQVPTDKWPVTVLMIATGAALGTPPRVWCVTFQGEQPGTIEILTTPRLYLEGAYINAFTLIYGFDPQMIEGLQKKLGIPEADFEDAWQKIDVLRPIDKLSLGSMPIQDAIDLAVFIATTQVQMDRFLPGEPACGGPIDVMVLRTAPYPEILSFPGKELRHPITRS